MTQESIKFALIGWLKTNKSLSLLGLWIVPITGGRPLAFTPCVQQHLTLKATFSVLTFPQFQFLTFILVFTFSFIY